MTQGVLLIVLAGIGLSAHVLAQGLVHSIVAGSSWAVGPRDDLPPRETVLGRRLHRAMVNYAETLPICLTILIAAELSGRSGDAVLYGGGYGSGAGSSTCRPMPSGYAICAVSPGWRDHGTRRDDAGASAAVNGAYKPGHSGTPPQSRTERKTIDAYHVIPKSRSRAISFQ